jgi:23S rRNA pseudouridine1911/1915/1917 synthase
MKIPVKEKSMLFDFLLDKLSTTSKTKIRKLIKHGGIILNGESINMPDHFLLPGQIIEIRRPTQPPPFPVLYEDRYVISLEKPPGLLSVSTGKGHSNTFYKAVNQYIQLRSNHKERVFIVHRLDREVSGIMLFAKTLEIKDALQKNWSETEKLYCALVEGHPPRKEDTIKSWLKESPIHKVYSCPKGPHAKYAVTHYRQLKEYLRYALLEIRPETGRKNQIRTHLSEIGCPIIGDKKYGATGNPIRRLALHAFALSFTHPVSGKRIRLESPVPKIFIVFGKRDERQRNIRRGIY